MKLPSYVTRDLDIYDVTMHLARNKRSWAALRRKYPKALPAIESDTGGLTCYMGDVVCFYIPACDDLGQGLTVLAHEAAHAAGAILDHRGVALVDGEAEDGGSIGSEALAYLTGWLTRWLWQNTHDAV